MFGELFGPRKIFEGLPVELDILNAATATMGAAPHRSLATVVLTRRKHVLSAQWRGRSSRIAGYFTPENWKRGHQLRLSQPGRETTSVLRIARRMTMSDRKERNLVSAFSVFHDRQNSHFT